MERAARGKRESLLGIVKSFIVSSYENRLQADAKVTAISG